MSSEVERPPFRCPVCRAKQSLRVTCRRCDADLRLLVAAHRRIEHLLHGRSRALAIGDREAEERICTELMMLAPDRIER